MSAPGRRLRRGLARYLRVGLVLALAYSAVGLPSLAQTTEPPAAAANPRFEEVARMPLVWGPAVDDGYAVNSGWLIMNPKTRRAYQVFEGFNLLGRGSATTIQSFDLDTLAPLRRATFSGNPVTSGVSDVANSGSTQWAGEVVHAVDEERGMVYLALSEPQADVHDPAAFANIPFQSLATTGFPPDGQRPLTRFVAIDEHKLDAGAADFAASFREPLHQLPLHHFNVMSMAVTRHHVRPGEPGRLVVLFAQPQPASVGVAHAHTLTQWDPRGLAFAAGAATSPAATPVAPAADWERRLDVCVRASLASTQGNRNGNYQWGLLITARTIYTACQTAERSGAAVVIELGANGAPLPAGGMQAYPMSAALSDVLADEGAERLLLRSWGNGNTWWVFDGRTRRFTGSIAAKQTDAESMATGIDPTTGRLYTLFPDYGVLDNRRVLVPIRGGIFVSDTRLDPAPPLENVAPSMAYPAFTRIRVDPVTRRVFVRRGTPGLVGRIVYPGTQATTPARSESFYRVFQDRIPLTERPAEGDDSAFTTDVAEDGLTRASYLGSGSGFGTRVVLTGGLNAATQNATSPSPCGSHDRELLAGSVNSVSVSDLSVAAEAAALDGDAGTQEALARPARRCTHPSYPQDDRADTTELSFDERKADGSAGKDGVNDYLARCVGDGGDSPPRAERRVPRDEFKASTTCDQREQWAEAQAQGALLVPQADAAQDAAAERAGSNASVPAERLRVAFSRSEVSVDREAGAGVKVTVDSIARGIDIPGVGRIGVVRAVATSTANGRVGKTTVATFERTVCGVDLRDFDVPGCVSEAQMGTFAEHLNDALVGRGRARLRRPDPRMLAGSASGYQAATQRDRDDRFGDTVIDKDNSLAVPGLELVLYNGDGGGNGAGRQIFHFAGVQASTSYGISCLYGQGPGGVCAEAAGPFAAPAPDAEPPSGGDPNVVTVVEHGAAWDAGDSGGASPGAPAAPRAEPRLVRIVKAPFRAAAEVMRLLFNNPRELGLMAAVWALLYAPCYLTERRRNIVGLRAH